MFLEGVLDARLIVLNIVSISVPGSLFVEEPGVTGPQKAVEKPKQNGGIGFSQTPHWVWLTVLDGCIPEVAVVRPLAGVILLVDPGLPVRNRLQIEKPVGPGRGCSEPDEGNEGCQEEVDLWVVLLLVSVEAGVEEVEGQTVREYDIATAGSGELSITWPWSRATPSLL